MLPENGNVVSEMAPLIPCPKDVMSDSKNTEYSKIIQHCLETLVLNPDLEEGMNESIARVREAIHADRMFILRFGTELDTGKMTANFDKESCAPGRNPLFRDISGVPLSAGIDWLKHFGKECFLNFPDIQAPDVLAVFDPFYRKLILQENIRSLYCHRVLIDGKITGYVGLTFENAPRILDQESLDFVQSIARLVEVMIKHNQMQSNLLRALNEAKAAEKVESNFLAIMSHEIRTSLNAVICFSEILKDKSLSPENQKEYLADISIAGSALLALINDILDLAKLESGHMAFAPSETDFPALVDEVFIMFKSRLRDKNLTSRVSIQPMPLLMLDKIRMRQILFNLVGNAVKFTDKGHIEFVAEFIPNDDGTQNAHDVHDVHDAHDAHDAHEGTLRFSVTDTGCGISEEDQKQLFQPFTQSKAIRGTQVANNGTGLGLVIVRKMLDQLNSSIKLQSTPGVGSTFTVERRNVSYVRKSLGRTGKIDSEQVKLNPMGASLGRVLVVDDVAMNRKVMGILLRQMNIPSFTADSAKEALKQLEVHDFSVILCDLWMPEMDGEELARKIRELYPHRKMRLIALTADTEAEENFNLSLFDGILRKPVCFNDLRKVCGKAVIGRGQGAEGQVCVDINTIFNPRSHATPSVRDC